MMEAREPFSAGGEQAGPSSKHVGLRLLGELKPIRSSQRSTPPCVGLQCDMLGRVHEGSEDLKEYVYRATDILGLRSHSEPKLIF